MFEWMNQVLEGVFSHAVYDLLAAGLVGGLIGYVGRRWPVWSSRIMYGVSAFTLFLLLSYVFTGRPVLSKEQPPTTVDNVESNVKAWVYNFHFGLTPLEDPNNYFTFSIQLSNGNRFYVGRVRAKDHYLLIQSNIDTAPDLYEEMKKLSPKQIRDTYQAVDLELARLKMGHEELPADGLTPATPIKRIVITRLIPISTALTESVFVDALQDMDNAMAAAKDSFSSKLDTFPELSH